MNRIRIGNQTACSASNALEPFHFALENNFDAFEWFSDKKFDAHGTRGWEESDFDAQTRADIQRTGRERDMLFTVHAPWQANPLHPEGEGLLKRSCDFARDIGASVVNLHLYMESGAQAYVRGLLPVLKHAANLNLRVSIENTPQTTPAHFNEVFALFQRSGEVKPGSLGMCLDIGHANLCDTTRNDFLRYMDEISAAVPIIHLHVHENYGDADSHLPLFTGPSGRDDAGIRAFLERLRKRDYSGAMILEQWPHPAGLLTSARDRLRTLLAGR